MREVQAQLYQVKKISVIAQGADVLVREYLLGPGDSIPWHHHTRVTDHYYCLEGVVLVETRRRMRATNCIRRVRHCDASAGAPYIQSVRPTMPLPADSGVGEYDFIKEE